MDTTYNFQHISETEEVFFHEIRFTLDNVPFSVIVHKPHYSRSTYRVESIYHETKECCPFCKTVSFQGDCHVLKEELEALFPQVILTNTLRLPWLFREYELI